ncbi:MAG: Lrp/AsnC ligand binding domain-containing protein [Solirubrobacteraceae bacterium]|nr:Lrp/AsnC ligand binding domain-containing protein [Patulibacter sp.]
MNASAVVLIEAERTAMLTLGPTLAAVPGVRRVYSVTGEWDFVCTIDVDAHSKLRTVITETIQTIDGVSRTQTLVALDTYEGSGGAA